MVASRFVGLLLGSEGRRCVATLLPQPPRLQEAGELPGSPLGFRV